MKQKHGDALTDVRVSPCVLLRLGVVLEPVYHGRALLSIPGAGFRHVPFLIVARKAHIQPTALDPLDLALVVAQPGNHARHAAGDRALILAGQRYDDG